jgi:hypothetical protein
MWVTGVEFHTPLNRFITVGQITRPTVIYLLNYTEYICLFLLLHLDSFNFRNNKIDKLLQFVLLQNMPHEVRLCTLLLRSDWYHALKRLPF